MLCNIYTKDTNQELKRLGIYSSTPVFFVNLSQHVYGRIKEMEIPKVLEVYLIQEDPYLKNLSNTWVNGGVQLPEVKIVEVEKIVQLPPKIIEKTIEVPVEVEVIREVFRDVPVEVIKEVEVVKEPELLNESAELSTDDDDSILIDTKVAFEDWKSKNKTQKAEEVIYNEDSVNVFTGEPVVEVVEEVKTQEYVEENALLHTQLESTLDNNIDSKQEMEDSFVVPEVVDSSIEESIEPILLEEQPDTVEEIPVVKTRRGKEIQAVEEFTVELTEEELKEYEDAKLEE